MSDSSIIARYAKKTISWRVNEATYELAVSQDLFSSFKIDRGTEFLLKKLAKTEKRYPAALDVGCGYGPIPLWLAATQTAESVVAVDRDSLAVAFTRHNLASNGFEVDARASLGFSAFSTGANSAHQRFDLIMSNVPAKAGEKVHQDMLWGASRYLREGGEVWIVIVPELDASISAMLAHEQVEVLDRDEISTHLVYRYRFHGEIEPPSHPYRRHLTSFALGDERYEMECALGLPEFDTRSHTTDLVYKTAFARVEHQPPRELMVINPGQGHLPVMMTQALSGIGAMHLVGRDLLALETSRANLARGGFTGLIHFHAMPMPDESLLGDRKTVDLLTLWPVNQGEGFDIVSENLLQFLSQQDHSPLVLAGASGFMGRIRKKLNSAGYKVRDKKRKGVAVLSVFSST